MKHLVTTLVCFLAALAIVFVAPLVLHTNVAGSFTSASAVSDSILPQQVQGSYSDSHEFYELYDSGKLVGVLHDRNRLDAFLKNVYRQDYAKDFPGSALNLGKDVVLSAVNTYYDYEDIDDEILDYLYEQKLFTLKATGVEFSDGNGIYAKIYCASEDLYEQALSTYLSMFVSSDDLAVLNSGQTPEPLRTYGSRTLSVSVDQTITTHEAWADADEIMTSVDQVLNYLEYGDNEEREYYTVERYDTVAGIGAKYYGLSATQVMNINRDKITSVDQVLQEGEELCITYFTSPIDITVNKERMAREEISPGTIYREDDTLREGTSQVVTTGIAGAKNSLYAEKWVNGVLVSGSLLSSMDTLQPVDTVVAVGTLVIPGVGTGTMTWPIDNVSITCPWGCYFGHRAVDLQNRYNRYGNVYAADNGVVEVNSYNGVNGNYLVINHNNGYKTYYGHMNVPSPLKVGDVVARGDVIGQIGMTGRASGPHVHFFIVSEDETVRYDPCRFDGFPSCDGL